MEGFTYTNIFETKALEYLFVIFFFVLLVPFWIMVNKKRRPVMKESGMHSLLSADSISLPQGLFFSRYHTWVFLENNGLAKIGVNDILLHLTGEVSIHNYKKPGDEIKKGEPLIRLHYNENSLQVISPVSGKISQVNGLLSENPGLIKKDPYRNGWLFTLKPDNWKADTDSCYLAEDANSWAKAELVRIKDFLAASSMKNMPEPASLVLQDGGELAEKALTGFPQEVWWQFQEKFLT